MAAARVLVVDDEPTLRSVVAQYLQLEGYETVEAADGAEALERLRHERPDLIVLDLMMPRVDGRAFLERLRQLEELSHTPVLVVTAGGSPHSVSGFPNVRALVQKPFDFARLVWHAEQILADGRSETGAA